ncbi:spermidine/putrescine ABC transporter substrate-binding protein [Photobacterium angustum]|uniref:Putrescine-binding periplasmic protein n=1 Tax=Photobacterium angustum (strain S14 / CCUG 15956) TaxID=314292 RepID=Q1ZU04_PHOAS|nr:spermidine/putrescine ABC transporter substrate-binding protein [Photobacterium angustum]EAS66606.1 spermidine/putrescine ABC transporter, periplasmic spermidine/putrescine-binding protein [Photobacterium angustum S14]
MKKTFKGVTTLAFVLSAFNASASDAVLNIYNWAEYMPTDVIQAFEKEYNVTVNYSTFENNEAMYSRLKLLKNKGYDVVFASTYFIEKMAREGMLAKIDKTKMHHLKDIYPGLLDQKFDPKNDYSLPYVWGVTGISYNANNIKSNQITSWNDLWNGKFQNQVMLLDDVRDVFGMALKTQGHSINTTNEAEIKQAYEKLRDLQPNVVVYNSDAPDVPYVTGEAMLGMQWNGSAYEARKEMPELKFVYPKEGSILWMDNFVVPEGSKNKELAYQFIDFFMRPENQARVIEEYGFPVPNKKAKSFLPKALQNDPMIFPTDEEVNKGEFTNDVGDAVNIYQKYWQMLKS